MARFHLSKAAARDLRDIIAYIRKRSPAAAKRVKGELRSELAKLAASPHLGHRRDDLIDEPLLFWLCYSYLIVYDPETKPLEIVRIIHGARNPRRFFSDK